MSETTECAESGQLHTAMCELLAEWLAASGDLQQASKSDHSRQSKIAALKESEARLKAAQSRYSMHIREHGCRLSAPPRIVNHSK
jgi:hypothetical protein